MPAEIDRLMEAQAQAAAAAQKVIRAGMHMIVSGYGNLALLPYIAPTGAWRCEYHVVGRPDRTFFRYTAASGAKYLADHSGGTLRRSIQPAALAEAIMKSVPDHLRVQCQGDATAETIRWLAQLGAELDAGRLPFAFHEFSEADHGWSTFVLGDSNSVHTMPSPPEYVVRLPVSPTDMPFWAGYRDRIKDLQHCEEALFCPEDIQGEEITQIARQLWCDIQGLDEVDGVELARRALEAALAALSC